MNLKSLIRDIQDFPKKGILFRDISPLLAKPEALGYVAERAGYHVHQVATLINLSALNQMRFRGQKVHSLIEY